MKRLFLSLLVALALSVSAFAMEVPTDTVVQNLNGSQQLIKTYTLPPGSDPQALIEEPFHLEGYVYTFADIVKAENHVSDKDSHMETVTLETSTKELSDILAQLAPTMEYDDGAYAGTLSLDHTSIRTEASGYTTRSRTISATKTIGPVDRNDMSYVPATTVKDGVTLSLSSVDWQITGTDVVGESLAPCSYQAVAKYSGKTYYQAATGYITTANYVGEISRDDVESVTYRVTYIGTEAAAASDEPAGQAPASPAAASGRSRVFVCAAIGAAVVLAALLLIFLLRRRAHRLHTADDDGEHDESEGEIR